MQDHALRGNMNSALAGSVFLLTEPGLESYVLGWLLAKPCCRYGRGRRVKRGGEKLFW